MSRGAWACLLVAIVAVSVAACNKKAEPGSELRQLLLRGVGDGGRSITAEQGPSGVRAGGGVAPAAPAPSPAARKIIRSGSLTLEVKELDAALEKLRAETTAAGGYIANESHQTVENGVRSAQLTCRVPVARFDGSIRAWRGLGHEEAFSLAAEDITEQYSDNEVTLRNQQKLEARLVELLNRPSNQLNDLLEIEKEAARVRSEIETIESRKRLWDTQVALANLVISLHEPRPVLAGGEGGPLQTLKIAFLQAADNFVDTVAGLIAALGVIVPLTAALAVAWWIVRALWRRRRKRAGL